MSTVALPTRRTEAWRYSDLARALPGVSLPSPVDATRVVEALAGDVQRMDVPAGEHCVVVDRIHAAALEARATSAVVGPGATLTRVLLQTASQGVPLNAIRVHLEAGATFRQFTYAEGARLARFETEVSVQGEGVRVEINGAYLVADGLHADFTSAVIHDRPGGETRQLIKGVARKGGRGVFKGKILVAPHAQKTDARQHHDALLLEDGAEIFAKPELEIHADDVQCAHGNTVGGLDEAVLFYLRQRGIPESAARALLIEAFLAEAIMEGLPDDLDSEIRERMRTWLGATP